MSEVAAPGAGQAPRTAAPVARTAEDDRYFVASQWQLMWRKFARHKLAIAGGAVLAVFYLFAAFSEFFATHDIRKHNAEFVFMRPQKAFRRVYQEDPETLRARLHHGRHLRLLRRHDRHAIRAVRDQLQRRRDALIEEWDEARKVAHALREKAERRLQEVRAELQREMPSLLKSAAFFVDGATDRGEKSHFFGWQIVEAANALGYYANRETYRSWARLVMEDADADRTELLVAFHGLGQEFQGVLACTAVCFQRSATEAGDRQDTSGEPVCDGVFQINYKDPGQEPTRGS